MNTDNSGNNGIFSKWQERLRRMRMLRRKKKELEQEENDQFIQEKVNEIKKVVEQRPRIRGKGIAVIKEDKREVIKKDSVVKKQGDISQNVTQEPSISVVSPGVVREANHSVDSNTKGETIQRVDLKNIPQKEGVIHQEHKKVGIDLSNDKAQRALDNGQSIKPNTGISLQDEANHLLEVKGKGIDDSDKLSKLRTDIIYKIKDSFQEKLNELDVLEGELFLLQEEGKDILVRKDIIEIRKKIDNYIKELNELIREYNAYSRNVYLDNIVEIDDSIIVDDLANYKGLLDQSKDEKDMVKDFKKLEEFKELYDRLQEAKSEVNELKDKVYEKSLAIHDRDSKYQKIIHDVLAVSQIQKSVMGEISRQNEYFSELMKKVNKINHEEYYTTQLKGLNHLLASTLRYTGIMLLSPLAGLFPSIAIQASATRRMVHNAYDQLHFEKVRHVVYRGEDLESEINDKLTDVKYVTNMVYNTITDIIRLRDDFLRQYNSDIPGYQDTLKNINSIYEVVYNSYSKLNIIEKNLDLGKKMNREKMVRVRELNENH